MIDAQVSSHCTILNSAERLQLIKKANEITAVMADIENQRLKKAQEMRERKEEEEAAKKLRQDARQKKQKEEEATATEKN